MSADFDPYQKWLGIPPAEQPPTHYRLLGLPPGEPDADKIASVVKRLTAYCQARAKGQNGAHALRVLESVAAAEACLLDPRAKADYDASLNGVATNANGHAEDAQFAAAEAENYEQFAPVVEAVSRPVSAAPIKKTVPVKQEPQSVPVAEPAEPAGEESFFDGMDFSATRSTDAKKAASAKGGFGKPATKTSSVLSSAGIGANKAKSAAVASSKSAGGKFKLQTWQIYAMAAGGVAFFILAVVIVVSLTSGPAPQRQAPVVKSEPPPQFVPAQFDAAKAAEEMAKKKRVPFGRAFTEAPIRRVGNFFFADITINGKPAGNFLLDTGAPVTVMKDSVAKKLGLVESSKARIRVVGGGQQVSFRKVDSLKIKDAHWEELNPAVVDLTAWQKMVGAEFDGVIGCDVWREAMFGIDPGKNKVVFYDRDQAPISNDAQFLTVIDDRPFIEVKLDGGEEARYMLATGCGHDLMKKPAGDPAGAEQGAADGNPEKIGVLSIFGKDHKDLTQIVGRPDDAYISSDVRQAGVVGGRILANYMMVMDFQRNKIMVVPQKK